MMDDYISRQAAINELIAFKEAHKADRFTGDFLHWTGIKAMIENLPSAEPERLTDDDFETIRIHLNSYKEKLCNQRRWKEAEEYQRIIDRFMAFASAQPEEAVPHRNYKYLSDFWCECGNHLGKKGDIKYCSDCGKKVKWDE